MNRKQRRVSQSKAKHDPKVIIRGVNYTLDQAFALAVENENRKNMSEAQAIYQTILTYAPQHVYSLNNLGLIMYNHDFVDEAIRLYRTAIRQDPDYAFAYQNLGDALMSRGEVQEAEAMFRKAIAVKPDFSKAFNSLVHIHRYTSPDHPDAEQIVRLIQHSKEDREHLLFALGKIYDDCGLYDKAFGCYQAANQICRARVQCNHAAMTADTHAIIDTFTKDFLEQCRPFGSDSKAPLFIVGMPRSGTTLLASILSSHPAIEVAGELPTIIECSAMLPGLLQSPVPYPQAVRSIHADAVSYLVKHYEARLWQGIKPGATYIIDKHPINFSRLGLISTLYPNARIIHCTRNPMDTCLSNYFQNFADAYFYSFDLQDVGHFYSGYAKLMAHWRNVLPDTMLEISYEDTVRHTEQTARKILAFLGLEWDERCLEHHTNRNALRTASAWQVRQPIYTTSAERWRNYEKHLAPLKSMLRYE